MHIQTNPQVKMQHLVVPDMSQLAESLAHHRTIRVLTFAMQPPPTSYFEPKYLNLHELYFRLLIPHLTLDSLYVYALCLDDDIVDRFDED